MIKYLIPFIASLLITLILTPMIRRWAIGKKYYDQPNERKIHTNPIPRLGGIAIFLSWLIVTITIYIIDPNLLHFSTEKLLGIDKNLLGVIIGALILFITGVVDDIKGMKPPVKLVLIIIASSVVALCGIKIWWFSNPFGNLLVLGSWSFVFVVLWVTLIVNVLNWLDGIDGLATGVSIIAAIVLFLLSISDNVNQPSISILLSVFAGSLIGFLPYNFNPAKIFLGDSGSLFLGFIIAIAAIISGGKVATAFLVLGLPIIDVFWVIIGRIMHKKSPMKADRTHLHHRLLDAGFSQKQIVILFYLVSATFGYLALKNTTLGKFEASLWLFVIMIALAIILFFSKIIRNKKRTI
ncbi:MAG: MraY family glycosyltransferase [Patescibacteria group bacterium]